MKYIFDDCELDLDTREITRSGYEVRVEPQVFDLLAYLVEYPGKLITHDELIAVVWRGRVVSDSAIVARISAARKAIGDNGKSQRIIKTISRKGFKFLSEVTGTADVESDRQSTSKASGASAPDGSLDHQEIHFCKSRNGARIAYAVSGKGIPLVRTGHWLTHLVLHGGYARGRLVHENQADREQGEAILKLIEHGWGVTGSPFVKAFTTMYIPDASRTHMEPVFLGTRPFRGLLSAQLSCR